MNAWLWIAAGLVLAVVPLAAVAALRGAADGLVALELAAVLTPVALLLISEGTNREPFGDLALVAAVVSFAGSLAYLRFLERIR